MEGLIWAIDWYAKNADRSTIQTPIACIVIIAGDFLTPNTAAEAPLLMEGDRELEA